MWKGMRRFLFLSPSHDLLHRHYRSKSQEAPGYEAALEAQADLECCF